MYIYILYMHTCIYACVCVCIIDFLAGPAQLETV